MKTTKLFFMAALAILMTACSSDDNELTQLPVKAEGITITAQLAPKSSSAKTRAVTESGNKIVVDWAVNEHLAILYSKDGNQMADATIKSVDGSGNATIEFTVVDGTADDTDCQIIYPYSAAKDDKTGVKDAATLLGAQDGTLNANLDVRVGAGTIQTTTPGLTVTTQPAAQFAIFKFTLQDLSAAAKSATEFKISDGSGSVITTVTPGSASGELYVALPVMAAGTYWFNAFIDSKPYIAKATMAAATVAGKYYQTTVKMATIGDVILSDGKFAARSSKGTNVAMIAYLGSETDHATYKHGLALALTDEASTMNWTTAKSTCEAKSAVPNASWKLPSKDQWDKMINACKNVLGTKNNYQDLRDGFGDITGASNLQSDDYDSYYWSSTEYEYDSGRAWDYYFDEGSWSYDPKDDSGGRVRACLAF